MAKAKSETAIAVTNAKGELVNYDYGQQAGVGWENTDQDHFSIAFINQLQSLSPELEEDGEKYIEGAKPGMFVNSVTGELMTELHFVPCMTQQSMVEWVPRDSGGGFVGVHEKHSAIVEEARASAVDRNSLVTKEGNQLIDTFYIYAGILDSTGEEVSELAVIAFTATKQKPYRAIMTRLRTVKGASNIPIFANRITMTAIKAKNKAGQPYFNVEMKPMIDNDVMASLLAPTSPILEQAQAFAESVSSGESKPKYEASGEAKSGDAPDEVF